MCALGTDASYEHSDVSALTPPVSMQFIEYEKTKVLEDGVPNGVFTMPGQNEFQHHVVRQKDVRRGLAQRLAIFFSELSRVRCVADGKRRTGTLLECRGVSLKLLDLRIDQSVHRVNEHRLDTAAKAVRFEQMIEHRADEGQ